MPTIPKEIGNRIRLVRLNKGETQETMANALGITPGAYAKIERGETDTSVTRLHEIAKILKVDAHQFMHDGAANAGAVSRAEMDLLYTHLSHLTTDLGQIKADLSTIKTAVTKKK